MKVRTNIKAGNIVQDAIQQVEDVYKEINQRLNKTRVSISGWEGGRGS
jgi:hypothetical protein